VVIGVLRSVSSGIALSFKVWIIMGILGATLYRDKLDILIVPPCSGAMAKGRLEFNRGLFASHATSGDFVNFNGVYFKYLDTVILLGKSNDSTKGFPTLIRKLSLKDDSGCLITMP
jgi:hypothetical protein